MSAHERAGRDRDPAAASPREARAVPPAGRFATILGLQGSAGNRAVARLLTTDHDEAGPAAATAGGGATTSVRHLAIPMSVTIRRTDSDAAPGGDRADQLDPAQVTAALTAGLSAVAEPAAGEAVRLPDMVVPEGAMIDTDTVGGAVTYNGSITRSGAVSPFGETSWGAFSLTGITVTPGPGTFTVAATLRNPITFNVASGGNEPVPSETAAVLTAANWSAAANDLTPNMADLGGRPPRHHFWAEDLTVRHERFHADERTLHARNGTATAQAWLTAQSAGSVADVQALLAQVPARVIALSQAAMPYPAKEERAYGDGAPAYRARADAIRVKGARGDYP